MSFALVRARDLEHLASLWIALAYGATGAPALGREIAFRLVRRCPGCDQPIREAR